MKDTLFPRLLTTPCYEYKMDHTRRGKAYIFNYCKFNDVLTPRKGTELDVERLGSILSNCYGFEVHICTDYTQGKIYNTLRKAASEDYSNYDCILIVVMSHGEEGKLYAKDSLYKVEDLWIPFTKCQTLVGKPKLFFIQSFWGSSLHAAPNPMSKFVVPSSPDILIMYSTFEGYCAVMATKSIGSWFIQRLCDELESAEHCNKDLVQILTHVNLLKEKNIRLICHEYGNRNQVGVIVSSLTRLIYLTRKN